MDLTSLVVADIVAITIVVVTAAGFDLWTPPTAVRSAARRVRQGARGREQAPALVPVARPIEQVAENARRLHDRFHQPAEGLSYAKVEAIRRAYDQVLAEGCQNMRIEHLLGVLPPGEELDLERSRVEAKLESCGLALSLKP